MAVNHTQDLTLDDRLAKIEAQNDAIIKALQKKKKNVVFVSTHLVNEVLFYPCVRYFFLIA